jgi:hypothetical protein
LSSFHVELSTTKSLYTSLCSSAILSSAVLRAVNSKEVAPRRTPSEKAGTVFSVMLTLLEKPSSEVTMG